eukprot:2617704-Prymnesium_polylepis.1
MGEVNRRAAIGEAHGDGCGLHALCGSQSSHVAAASLPEPLHDRSWKQQRPVPASKVAGRLSTLLAGHVLVPFRSRCARIHVTLYRLLSCRHRQDTLNHPRREAVDLAKKTCKIPIEWDSKSGKARQNGWWRRPDRLHPGGRCYVCGVRAMREGLDVGENARWSRFACKHCRVILCEDCWDLFDHENQRAPPDLPPAAAGKSRPHTTPSNAKPHGPDMPAAPQLSGGPPHAWQHH